MKLNRNGITLIELLGAVTILSILSGLAVVAVSGVIQNSRQKHYETAEKNIEMAAESYAQQNRSVLPKVTGQTTTIALSTLIEKNYIQPIKDHTDKECNSSGSYVKIYKHSQKGYSYTAHLECNGYKTN